jgi:hypothetical protein
LAEDARPKRFEVGQDVGKLGHLGMGWDALRLCAYGTDPARGR